MAVSYLQAGMEVARGLVPGICCSVEKRSLNDSRALFIDTGAGLIPYSWGDGGARRPEAPGGAEEPLVQQASERREFLVS